MSKILEKKEAQDIANKLCESFGFNPPVADWANNPGEQFRLCNKVTKKKTVGWWLWKKTVEVEVLDPVFTAGCWEDALAKLEQWLDSEGRRRVEKADKLRDRRDTILVEQKCLE